MKIAILGWGSLVWAPRNLEIDKRIGQNGWFDDGPMLPIEFARISSGPRLTLVIRPESEVVQTLFAISSNDNLHQAILNLSKRERCNKENIGYFDRTENSFSNPNFQFIRNIIDWIEVKNEIEAVIWTDLPENFQEKTGKSFNEENTISYLTNLQTKEKIGAEEYIRKAPSVISTPIRKAFEEKLGWTIFKRINISAINFKEI